jgi:probable rRNA maturation factor
MTRVRGSGSGVRGPRCLIEWAGEDVGETARGLAQRAVDAALAMDRLRKRSLCVLVVDDAESARLHGQHFDDSTPTDVMSFPDGAPDPASGLTRLGDLAVGLEVARRVAKQRGRPVDEEIALYVLHGTLHLLGHDDIEDADREAMWTVQRAVMSKLGITID